MKFPGKEDSVTVYWDITSTSFQIAFLLVKLFWDFQILSMYFRYYVIITPWKRAGPFI